MSRAALCLAIGLLGAVAPLAAQERRCTFRLRNVDREGLRVEPVPGVVNYFAGGNVQIECIGQNVQMRADSLAVYQGTVAQFIGNVS